MNSLPKTVTRQNRGCDLNQGPASPESSTLSTRIITVTSLVWWCMTSVFGSRLSRRRTGSVHAVSADRRRRTQRSANESTGVPPRTPACSAADDGRQVPAGLPVIALSGSVATTAG